MTVDAAPWPTELRVRDDGRRLLIAFDSGENFDLSAELIRVESPSAETQGHGGERPAPPAGRSSVRIVGATPVGRYAVRLAFSDGHDSGLFTWAFLYELGRDRDARFEAYVKRLEAHGLAR